MVRATIRDLCLYKLRNSHAVWLYTGGKRPSEKESLFRMQNNSRLQVVPSSPTLSSRDLEVPFLLFSAWGRGCLWHLLSFLSTFFCRSGIQHLQGRRSNLSLHPPSTGELVLGRIFVSANLMCFSLACRTAVLRSNA